MVSIPLTFDSSIRGKSAAESFEFEKEMSVKSPYRVLIVYFV